MRRLEKYIEADIFDIKNGDITKHFKLNNLEAQQSKYHVKTDAKIFIWIPQKYEIKVIYV